MPNKPGKAKLRTSADGQKIGIEGLAVGDAAVCKGILALTQ